MEVQVTHNPTAGRFEATIDGQLAVAEYQLSGEKILFTHTEVPRQFRGRGIAGQIVRAGLEYAREQGLTVLPLCPYVTDYIRRHPGYQPLTQRRDT